MVEEDGHGHDGSFCSPPPPTLATPPTSSEPTTVSTPHLPPEVPLPPRPERVTPLLADLGVAGGHRLVLLSLEVWDGWADLRFARIDEGADRPLPRRVPPAGSWEVQVDGARLEVLDAVGRGDRAFSNGEVRLRPAPAPGSRLHVRVEVTPGTPPLETAVDV
jgi:hypothetical protein